MIAALVITGAAALLIGAAAGWLITYSANKQRLAASEAMHLSEKKALEAKSELLATQVAEQKNSYERQLSEQYKLQRESAENQKQLFIQQLAEQKSQLQENAQKQYDQLKAEFQVLAEKILAQKSETMEKNGKTQLEALLTPLKTKLDEFKSNAEQTRKESLETNARLSEQIQLLMKSSRELGEEANQLARALRSDNKMQGNWGEMILDEILTASGLIEDVHYQRQATLTDDAGKALRNDESNSIMRPDVLVNYPDGKVVIVDSKVSLDAYVDWVNAEDDTVKSSALMRHLKSVKNHVDELVQKNYPAYVKKNQQEAVDFVVMFMPNEGAYELAMRHDVKLWQDAFARKVLIVSPVNLMALLQLIHLGWKRYDQERNQQKIVEAASELLYRVYQFYDKFDDIGKHLERTAKAYTDAADQLRGAGGKHSVVKKGEELKTLGVKMKKKMAIPARLEPDFMEDIPDAETAALPEDSSAE